MLLNHLNKILIVLCASKLGDIVIMKIQVILFLIILFLPNLVTAEVLTLEQCLTRGLADNPQVKAYRLAVKAEQEGIYESYGAFLPTLSINFGKSKLENNGDLGTQVDSLSQKNETLTVRFSQPLYTGLAGLSGLKRARQSHTYREYDLQLMEHQLLRVIKISFYEILQSEQLITKWIESVDRLEQQQKIAQAWVVQKLAPHQRELEVAVKLANARQELSGAEAALAIAKARLSEWIDLPPEEHLFVDGNLPQLPSHSCPSVESCLKQAMSQRPELQISKLNISIAQQDANIIRSRNLPKVSFDASWVDHQRKYDLDELDRDNQTYYTLGLNLSMQPFQGGKTIFAYKRKKIEIQRLKQVQHQQRNSITTEVRTRFQQLIAGKSRLVSATTGVDQAREAYRFAEQSAKLGVTSLEDLLLSEILLTRSEINRIRTVFDLQQAQVLLNYVIGN